MVLLLYDDDDDDDEKETPTKGREQQLISKCTRGTIHPLMRQSTIYLPPSL
jgi:hypothetical protein